MSNGNGVRAATIAAISALLISIVGNVTVYFDGRATRSDARQARIERIVQENQFFRSQCHRDFVRDNVIILALQDAIHRAQSSISDPAIRAQEVNIIQSRIDNIEAFRGDCEASVPSQGDTK